MIKKITYILLALCFCTLAWGSDNLMPLGSGWKFHQTDDINLHYNEIKDSDWRSVNLNTYLNVNTGDGVYGWYMLKFDWDKPIAEEKIALYIERIFQGDETYLNTIKIGGLGKIKTPWEFGETITPAGVPRNYIFNGNILKKENNVIAIKVNLGFSNINETEFFGGIGIENTNVFLGEPLTTTRQASSQLLSNSIIDISIVILSIVEIILILTLLKGTFSHFPEFPWLLISGILMVFGALSTDVFYVFNLRNQFTNMIGIIAILFTPLTLALYFCSINPTVPKKYVSIIILLFSIVAIGIALPWPPGNIKNILFSIWQPFTFTLLLYVIYNVIRGLIKKQTGMVVLFIGAIVYLFSIRIEWIMPNPLGPDSVLVGKLFFRYTMLFAYFQRINQMSHNYKELSEKMLTTIEKNKQSIARDLHDDLGQHLSAAKLRLILYYEGDVKESIAFIKEEINASIQSVRDIIQGLHPIILEQYTFKDALQKEADRLSNLHAVFITLKIENIVFNKKIEKHLFRIFQETIHNAIQHGKAKNIDVNLRISNQEICYKLSDDGAGFNPEDTKLPSQNSGFGLVSLRERVALINGRIHTKSTLDSGTIVTVHLPKVS